MVCGRLIFAWPPKIVICTGSRARSNRAPASGGLVTQAIASTVKSPLHEMTQTTPTCLWNDSASVQELSYSIENGAVGATCNPVIVLGVLKKEIERWKGRINSLIKELPTATEDQIAWQIVREISVEAASLLKP